MISSWVPILCQDDNADFEKSRAINYAALSYYCSNACVGEILNRGCQLRVAIL